MVGISWPWYWIHHWYLYCRKDDGQDLLEASGPEWWCSHAGASHTDHVPRELAHSSRFTVGPHLPFLLYSNVALKLDGTVGPQIKVSFG